MSADNASGPVGAVRVGDLLVTVTPLKMVEERALRRVLIKAAADAAGDYFTRCAKLLNAMKSTPAAYFKAVERITELAAIGPTVSEDQLFEFRESPAGVQIELFHRGRKATQGLTLDGLRAIITEANVDDVLFQMQLVQEGSNPNALTP